MKKWILALAAAGVGLSALGVVGKFALRPALAARDRDRDDDRDKKPEYGYTDKDYYPELKKKIVPIITVGSSLEVGAAQVAGAERDVDKVKVVAQLETDYKDVARIKILVPVQTQSFKHIDRVPGVSVTALADYKISK